MLSNVNVTCPMIEMAMTIPSRRREAFEKLEHKPKLVDAFIFYNEVPMLEYRFKTLNDVVDHFVVVESRQTFTGKDKPLVFEQHKPRFAPWLHKIQHVVMDMPHRDNAWKNEYAQRAAIDRGIKPLSLASTDLVLISDVDEIPDPETLRAQKLSFAGVGKGGCAVLVQDMYYYTIEHRLKAPWHWVKLMHYDHFVRHHKRADIIRARRSETVFVPRGGWHLSYFGNASFIQNKIQQFSHQEFNTESITNLSHIQAQIDAGKDLFHRANVSLEHVPRDQNEYLPPNLSELEQALL